MEVGKMNKMDIDTLIFILHRDYENYGINPYIERTIRNLAHEIVNEKVIKDKEFMKLL
jgi:hypothetical protein